MGCLSFPFPITFGKVESGTPRMLFMVSASGLVKVTGCFITVVRRPVYSPFPGLVVVPRRVATSLPMKHGHPAIDELKAQKNRCCRVRGPLTMGLLAP